ncbi:unnamed protein product [Caenorhabditis sp. 36 PRJEB53466]|nr:unnamed protein product [Caenorhabditis sp. 36 PRJEB53466]
MNVEEYFPEGLSVIHHDESHREKRASKEEIQTPSAAIHCHICYKSIHGAVNNVDFVKPCNCQLMFVHSRCASRNRVKFGEAKCSSCGQGSTIPRTAKLHHFGKIASLSGGGSEEGMTCSVCDDKNYENDTQNNKKTLGKKIKPCFCGKVMHFGCLSSLLSEKSSCLECSVLYYALEPASLKEFFARNWICYTLYITLLAILSTLLVMASKNSIIFPTKSSETGATTKKIILTITAVFFLLVIAASMLFVIKYTLSRAIPRFRVSRGKVILKPFKTGSGEKPSKKLLLPVQEDNFEDIPLNNLRKSSSGDVEEGEEPAEDVRANEIDDMTLGQHMFGVYATHHSSSTPIEKPPLGFVFNSV